MVNTQNNQGHTAIAMVINLALLAAVSVGVIAAVTSLVG